MARSETKRGFPGPGGSYANQLRQEREHFYIVRMTEHERELLRPESHGVHGRFCLLSLSDGTYELVRYADD